MTWNLTCVVSPQIDVRVSALSMVYDLLMRFGLAAFICKDDSDNVVEDHSDITALLDVELSARKRHLRRSINGDELRGSQGGNSIEKQLA